MTYTTTPLSTDSWELFADLVDRNNGIFGGCWCIGWHLERKTHGLDHRAEKQRLVTAGEAHAALVLDEDGVARGWAQYGSPAELPGIKHRRKYEQDAPPVPDWRIACVFTDKSHRGRGVARAAVTGAIEQIAAAGGGLVEAISEVTDGREAQGRFLFSGTVELFTDLGFDQVRQVGKHAWIVSRTVAPGGGDTPPG